jgi:hypothetical protein
LLVTPSFFVGLVVVEAATLGALIANGAWWLVIAGAGVLAAIGCFFLVEFAQKSKAHGAALEKKQYVKQFGYNPHGEPEVQRAFAEAAGSGAAAGGAFILAFVACLFGGWSGWGWLMPVGIGLVYLVTSAVICIRAEG